MTDAIDRFFAEWETQGVAMPAPDARVVYRLMRAARQLGRRLDATCAAHGLTRSQFEALAALRRRHPTPLCAQDLMDASFLTSGSVTALVGQLVRAGLVAREIDPADRRRLAVRLTEAGRLRIEAAVAERVADNERLGRLLPEGDTRTLDRLMRAYLGALEQETP